MGRGHSRISIINKKQISNSMVSGKEAEVSSACTQKAQTLRESY